MFGRATDGEQQSRACLVCASCNYLYVFMYYVCMHACMGLASPVRRRKLICYMLGEGVVLQSTDAAIWHGQSEYGVLVNKGINK